MGNTACRANRDVASPLRNDAFQTGIMLVIPQVRGEVITRRGWYPSRPLRWDGEESESELVGGQAVERIACDVWRRAHMLASVAKWVSTSVGFARTTLDTILEDIVPNEQVRSCQRNVGRMGFAVGSCKVRNNGFECGRGR